MSEISILEELRKKEDNVERIVQAAIDNKDIIPALIDAVESSETTVKFKSLKVLSMIGEREPSLLYPYFDFFTRLMQSDNNIPKWNAIDIIGNLTSIDTRGRFDAIFESYYGFLNEGSLITAAHVVESSARIARAKPGLQEYITSELLKAELIPLPTEECRNILKGKIINEFAKYFDQVGNKEQVLNFVKNQQGNTRSATKKKARLFLSKYDKLPGRPGK